MAVVANEKRLPGPHHRTDAEAVQWVVPGGRVEFGISLQEAVVRVFFEKTGLQAEVTGMMHVREVVLPDRPYHSITISFSGRVTGGELRAERNHPYVEGLSKWLSVPEVMAVRYHPEQTVKKALGITLE